jgi:hypothetical protein
VKRAKRNREHEQSRSKLSTTSMSSLYSTSIGPASSAMKTYSSTTTGQTVMSNATSITDASTITASAFTIGSYLTRDIDSRIESTWIFGV